jgi:hypothetical protein
MSVGFHIRVPIAILLITIALPISLVLALPPQTWELNGEKIKVQLSDPWQRKINAGKTDYLQIMVKLSIPHKQLKNGSLKIKFTSVRTGRQEISKQLVAPKSEMTIRIDTQQLAWGAYDVTVSFLDVSDCEILTKACKAKVLPGGKEQIRVLNNLVSELMNVKSRGILDKKRIDFMNPRNGWIWFSVSGDCSIYLNGHEKVLLKAKAKENSVEAMRLLPAGRHTIDIKGNLTDLVVHAIPAIVYNAFPLDPHVQPFGSHTWDRLSKRVLPNVNMIEGLVSGTAESKSWIANGKSWLANVQAPGLYDKQNWSIEKMLGVWRNPIGYDIFDLSGIQVDEYYSAIERDILQTTTSSIIRLSEDHLFKNKLWIPFIDGRFCTEDSESLIKNVITAGWPYSIMVYLGEMQKEDDNKENIKDEYLKVARKWEKVFPGAMRHAIFTLMYSYLPYCTSNRHPQANFRIHLDMQMQMLANDPEFFGLWGIQPYRSNYVDEEILNSMASLLRHYCIEGHKNRLFTDSYELKHIENPDFAEGVLNWEVDEGEKGSVMPGKFKGYGRLEGRYPPNSYGDTFLVLKRTDKRANIIRQVVKRLKPGNIYSLKIYTGDHRDLLAGRSRKKLTSLNIRVHGVELLTGGFQWPFRSVRGPDPFTKDHPFWMTYHWLRFRAQKDTAWLELSDWKNRIAPGGQIGQETMVNFIELQPVFME